MRFVGAEQQAMIRAHGRRPARELGKPDSETPQKARMDSSRNGRESRNRQEFSGRCRAGKAERLDSECGADREGIQGFAGAVVFEALGVGGFGISLSELMRGV